ncbi:DUF3810 domain-containing protein [Tenacibaculum sp. MEBiC06402]|uniref:DUF3810 domain-containing protein n=1 Tax=unclassified Tenacibaculum TaxID=2635139 RepID=UPI003B9D5FA8
MKPTKKTVFIAILLPFQVVFVNLISKNPQFVERYYSTGIYPYVSRFFRLIFGWLPFSVGDIIGLILICLLVFEIYKLFKNRFRNLTKKLIRLTAFLSILYFCFYSFWGLNYFREPLAKKLQLQSSQYSTEQLKTVTVFFLKKLNDIQVKITGNDTIKVNVPYSNSEIYDNVKDAYDNLSNEFPQLNYKSESIKSSVVSLFQSYNGTSGYLNPITGEAQINSMIPKAGMPSTACHEVAHQIGWSAENEANFVGFLASISSNDIYFNYSGYRMALRYCIRELRKREPELYKEFWFKINKGIRKELKDNYDFWKQYENPIEPYLKKGYNSYLKANNQSKGIESYSYVVDLLIAYTEQKNL